MRNRTTQSALMVAGAAVGAAAATWLGKRRLASVPSRDRLIEPESAELPLGRSADPEIDDALSRTMLPQDQTSGATLLAGEERFADESPTDASLDEVWNSLPGIAEGEQSEGYDAVSPEDLGAVWLERATQTTHEDRPHGSDPNDIPELEDLMVSQATIATSHQEDDEDEDKEEDEDDGLADEAEGDDDEIADDELDER